MFDKIKSIATVEIDLNSTDRRLKLVVITVVLGFLLLNIFEPFGIYHDDSIDKKIVFMELLIAMLAAFTVLLFFQFLFRKLFQLKQFLAFQLVLWFLLEGVFVALSWSTMDTTVKGISGDFIALWGENFLAYSLIMCFPYFSYSAIIHVQDMLKQKELVIDQTNDSSRVAEFIFNDETDATKLILKKENLLFIQSADNYVEIHYLDNSEVKKYLLRNSIKNLEVQFENSPLIRCHRSYMVNAINIQSAKKTTSGFELKLKSLVECVIPVSKSYSSLFKKYLTNYSES